MDKAGNMKKSSKASAVPTRTASLPSNNIRPEMYQWLVQESQKAKATPPATTGLPMANLPMMSLPMHNTNNVLQLQQLNQMMPLMPGYPGFIPGFAGTNNGAATALPNHTSFPQSNPLNLFNMVHPTSSPKDGSKQNGTSSTSSTPKAGDKRKAEESKSDVPMKQYITKDANGEINPQRKKRLERNRESARECRRRKRDHILGVEERCKALEKENMELRSQLKAGKEAMKQEEDEKTQICIELENMIHENAGEAEIAAKIDNFKEQYSDYGQGRRSALNYHLHQLERLLMPTQVTKMCIWALKQDDAFWEDGEDETSLLSILTHDLGLTEEQRKSIQSHRSAVVKICENLRLALQLLHQLKADVEQKNITLDTEMDQLQNILTPTQRAKVYKSNTTFYTPTQLVYCMGHKQPCMYASSQQTLDKCVLIYTKNKPYKMEDIGLKTMEMEDVEMLPLSDKQEDDMFSKYKALQRHLEFLDIQEGYIKDEMKNLKRELIRAKEEVKRIQSVPLVIGQFLEMVDANYGIVGSTAGSNYYVRILSTLDRERLKPNSSVALHRHSHAVVAILPPESDSSIQMMQMSERPDVSYSDIGGMDVQKQEVREAVELPLTHFDLYKQIGVDPPRGVLMYGPPGTGKTMLAKAVANATTASFIRVVGSEFVQKYLGEGPRMVRDVFRLAKENAPAIVFIDEVDAIATKRFDAQTGADREVQRILLELLNQMDGFDQATNVKVIMATNRADTLDPALLRPGRLDRKIEFPLPDRRQKRLIYQACTAQMNLGDEVDLEDYVNRPEKISSADIASICQEAGLQAVRKNRYVILPKDFDKGYKNAIKRADTTFDFYH
ncbi:26S protease regulatory subunit 6B [Thraustotheca clavata]|uniref:26S protease regulatory subunit 6B n=1 Tax=Thraustotheca clavata TaxID=74557 RepID=A0A1V9YYW9_9STRA|nr:26S protease regulatory subunit 6B [Thraustotheca clavata]